MATLCDGHCFFVVQVICIQLSAPTLSSSSVSRILLGCEIFGKFLYPFLQTISFEILSGEQITGVSAPELLPGGGASDVGMHVKEMAPERAFW